MKRVSAGFNSEPHHLTKSYEKNKMVKQVLQKIPMGRLGSASDIAHAVEFLMSEQSAYMTGTCLDINGGLVML